MTSKALCGLDVTFPNDLASHYDSTLAMGYNFLCTYMFHPGLKRDYLYGRTKDRPFPETRSDFILQENASDKTFSNSIVGKISPWIDVDSHINDIRRNSEKALMAELSWAAHLALPAISIRLHRKYNPNLARLLIQFLARERNPFKIWLHIPMVNPEFSDVNSIASPPTLSSEDLDAPGAQGDTMTNGSATDNTDSNDEDAISNKDWSWSEDTWFWWHNFSMLVSDWAESFFIQLEIPESLPPNACQKRWFSEPVSSLLVPTSIFCTNRREYPVLSSGHQAFINKFFKLNLQIVITGACRHKQGYPTYQKYIHHLWKNQGAPDLLAQQAKGMEDYLQEPLQPLMDNLCSRTYMIFEMDPYKYKAYEEAVYKALIERHPMPEDTSLPSASPPVVMVLGAGRGPLVAAAFSASDRAKRPIKMFVVEKNPNAVITLQNRVHDEWRNRDIKLLVGDMRTQHPDHKADIFVSELLGSFSDNELSPECLDGAQHFLKDSGISIPSTYTSYLTPIQSLKIYKEVTKQLDPHKSEYVSFETPYVVSLLNCNVLAEPQPVFRFDHPKKDPLDDNSRYACLTFNIKHDAVLHGFAGYFDCTLYGDIDMSILPSRHSPDMFSWFPIVFPLERPVRLRAGDKVTIAMWRVVGPKDVWYEWSLLEPVATRIHNPSGRSYKIGL